jgi:hypothetical protein
LMIPLGFNGRQDKMRGTSGLPCLDRWRATTRIPCFQQDI